MSDEIHLIFQTVSTKEQQTETVAGNVFGYHEIEPTYIEYLTTAYKLQFNLHFCDL